MSGGVRRWEQTQFTDTQSYGPVEVEHRGSA